MTIQATKKITSKITGYKVKTEEAPETSVPPVVVAETSNVVQMSEAISRPDMLLGATYKIKIPTSDHAMYCTINDYILNEGTENEERRPFEIFINSKNMGDFQWVVALTRLISAVFRKGGDSIFMVDELLAVFDPKGGYFKPGGVYVPSVVAEIGLLIKRHMQMIGMLETETLDKHQKEFLEKKRAELEANSSASDEVESAGSYPENATLCGKCSTKAVVLMDGCGVCLECGDSKCN